MWTKERLAPPTCPCLPPLRGTPAETMDLHDDLGLKNQNEKKDPGEFGSRTLFIARVVIVLPGHCEWSH